MNEVKFTKGPWAAISNGSYYDIGPKNDCSTIPIYPSVCIGVQLERKADAHLIAAAPEMYEMLEHVMKCAAIQDNELIEAEEIRNLLAEARGEKSVND